MPFMTTEELQKHHRHLLNSLALLDKAMRHRTPGAYQVQAAIAALPSRLHLRPRLAVVRWRRRLGHAAPCGGGLSGRDARLDPAVCPA